VRRVVETGDPLPDGEEVEVEVVLLRTAHWVKLREIEPVVEDIAAAFHIARISVEESRREIERAALYTGVPMYACEEAEDAAEEMFWERENRRYATELDRYGQEARSSRQFNSNARPRRSFGNRRHGANGYMASGHLLAVPHVDTEDSSAGA
jgi:hypothetical protein